MAELKFISETGMFHSACCCTWGNIVEWYGFKPRKHRSPAGQGFVDRTDRSAFVNHSVSFDVNDVTLRAAIRKVAGEYATKTYAVTVCDCVSFTADVARQVGLNVPLVNITPYVIHTGKRLCSRIRINDSSSEWDFNAPRCSLCLLGAVFQALMLRQVVGMIPCVFGGFWLSAWVSGCPPVDNGPLIDRCLSWCCLQSWNRRQRGRRIAEHDR